MAKPELGTKRTCPETGRKFYDLNRDPIISPYTGISYPRSFFETIVESMAEKNVEPEEKTLDQEVPEIIPLDSVDDGDVIAEEDDLPDLGDDDVDLGDDDDTFLEEEEDEDEDVTGIINVNDEDDDR